jgi:hypothetical protein
VRGVFGLGVFDDGAAEPDAAVHSTAGCAEDTAGVFERAGEEDEVSTLSKQLVHDIWLAHDEVEKAEKMLGEVEELLKSGEQLNLRDAFGRRRSFQFGIPSGESSHRLYDVHPSLALQVIKAHIATKRAELGLLNEQARSALSS